jgi:hypothetical protein
MKVVKPLDLILYVKKDAEKILARKFSWEKFQHKRHESRFPRFLEDYWLPKKFGYDRRRAYLSSMIMTGQMRREEALERIERPEFDPVFLKQEFEYVANKLGLSVAHLREIFAGKKKTCADFRNKRWMIDFAGRTMTMIGLKKRLYK